MCGVFGAVAAGESPLIADGPAHLDRLFALSASRGKEAAGLAIATDRAIHVFKQPMPAPKMIALPGFRALVSAELRAGAFIGHSRLVTDGAREINLNNQPVVCDGVVGIHNGIIVNHEALWNAHPDLQRRYDVDSEVIFALIRDGLARGRTLPAAVGETFAQLQGAASIAALFTDRDQLLLATNNGSLYYRSAATTFVFASERYILETFLADSGLGGALGAGLVIAVRPGDGVVVDHRTLAVTRFRFGEPAAAVEAPRTSRRPVADHSPVLPAPPPRPPAPDLQAIAARWPYVPTTHTLRRCSRCVLPETMPYITFDDAGVCTYCRNWQPIKQRGLPALQALVAPYRRDDGRPDCVVGVSGGRDSMYGLHYVKTVLKMNPVCFTYDWGMVTDLARRNVSRICGKLGIEHILVSADIDQKRGFIRKNVEAWLKRPTLGTVPLFMAGDKAFFHYLNQVRKQVEAPLGIFCENLYERTDFKSGFAGVRPHIADDVRAYTLNTRSKLRMAGYYLREFARNPAYLNSSLLDSAMAFAFFYVIKRDYTNLYGYVPWVEEEVNRTLIDVYDFELSPDTESTWRIGDGTASFYNYIYHTVAGFSEHDALRSNQIREGLMTRDEALARITRENQPRLPSIEQYLDVLGLASRMDDVIDAINRIPKLYAPRAPRVAEPARANVR